MEHPQNCHEYFHFPVGYGIIIRTNKLIKEAKMKIKQSLVILFTIAATIAVSTGRAFAADYLPAMLGATEQLHFDPLLYATTLLAALAFCSFVACLVFYRKYCTQKNLVCHNSACQNNPEARQNSDGVFDYRQMETPKEFAVVQSQQSAYALQGAQGVRISQPDMSQPARVGKHEVGYVASPPHILLMPDMRAPRAYRAPTPVPAPALEVPAELEYLMRKIS
jgi:hypothetical protein